MRAEIENPVSAPAPKPLNFEPMSEAWRQLVDFAREVTTYNDQLAGENLPPVTDWRSKFEENLAKGHRRDTA